MKVNRKLETDTYRHRSLWLKQVLVGEEDQPALRGHRDADIVIVGGGFVGLWTALRLRERGPGLRIVILEADICGGGASGRNGGMVLSWWPKASTLKALCGQEEALFLINASTDAIDEIGTFCSEHAPNAQFHLGGFLWTSTAPAHTGSWKAVQETSAKLGQPDVFHDLTPEQVAFRSGSSAHLAGVFEAHAATVHPGYLVRALRRVALERGIEIFENSPVSNITEGPTVRVNTPQGSVTSTKVVLATNAWAAAMKELRPYIFVISSDMIATEPAAEELKKIGWVGHEGIADSQTLVCYYRTDDDGRVLFGKGGWAIGMGSWMPPSMERHAGRARMVMEDFRRYYPRLGNKRVTDDWAGPIDRTYNSLPIFGHLGRHNNIIYGVGWSGNGVGPSVVGGRILASLALGTDDRWSNNGLVHAQHRKFPPEPFRYVGAHAVREAIVRKERRESQGREPLWLHKALASLAPSGLEDKE